MRSSLPEVSRSAANVNRFPGSDMTRIDRVVVIDDYSVARGGATGLAVLSAKLFRGLDIPVTYICGDDAANAELAALGVSMVGLNSRDLLSAERAKAFVTGIHNGAATRMVANWIAAKDTVNTVYHIHGWHQILSPALFRALAPVARRSVVHAHDFFTACPNGAFFDYQAQEICLRRARRGLPCDGLRQEKLFAQIVAGRPRLEHPPAFEGADRFRPDHPAA